jgi:hypothetical protein
VTRVLAYALEHAEGIVFSTVRDLSGSLRTLAARLERRMAFALSISGGELYVSIGDDTLTGAVVRHHLG